MRFAPVLLTVGLALPVTASAFEWSLGPAYASGISEVTDLYERNLRREGFDADVDLEFPIGLSVAFHYDWASGMRGDLGLGPMFFISGDVDHFELPLTATLGFNFAGGETFTPYARGGLAYHFADGDYYESSSPGLLLAAGVEFDRITVDLAYDSSELEFEAVQCPAVGPCTRGTTEFSTYEFVLSVLWKFY